MEGAELIIGDTSVDLKKGTTVATTIQAFDPRKIGSIKASFTNKFKVPKTPKNRALFEYLDNESSTSRLPYSHIPGVILKRSGIEVLGNAIATIDDTDDEHFEIMANSNAKGFFDAIDGLYLPDLNLGINSIWDAATRDTKRNATTGLVCPVMQWGQLLTGDNTTHGNFIPPTIYLSTIIDKIFERAGYSKSGNLFTKNRYLNTVIAAPFILDKDFTKSHEFNAYIVTPQVTPTLDTIGETYDVKYEVVNFQGSKNFYNPVTGLYTVVNTDTALDYAPMGFYSSLYITVTGAGTCNVKLMKNGTVLASNLAMAAGTYLVENDTIQAGYGSTKGIKNGDVFKVVVERNTGTTNVTINGGQFYNKMFVSSDTVKAMEPTWYHYFNKMLPRIALKDLITQVIIDYGCMIYEKAGTLYFYSYDDLVTSGDKVDWTSKLRSKSKEQNFDLDSFGQKNTFKWTVDEDGRIPDNFGEGYFNINNEKLPLEVSIFESDFSASESKSQFGTYMAYVPIYNTGTSLFTKLKNVRSRLFLVRDKTAQEQTVTYNGVARSDYKVAYFTDFRQTDSLDYQETVNKYYKYFPLKLNNYRVVDKTLLLSENDIHSFDPIRPVFIYDQSYLVIKINQFISSRKETKVTLFKI